MIIYCATTNPGKLREFRVIVEHFAAGRITVETLPGLREITPPEETGATFEDNAAIKACYYSRFAPGPLFADDSGLAVDALNGAPGVHSARYAGGGDEANNKLLLENLAGVADRTARFVCVIALADNGAVSNLWRGEVEGRIVDRDGGGVSDGFGYDPIFFHDGFGQTFGQVSAERKLLVSHRGKALAAMVESLLA